jgi:homoserine kinase type II
LAVFTPVTTADITQFLLQFPLGELSHLEGIKSGIENSNFFLDTTTGRYVLTIFERLSAQELPFYLDLTEHLAQHGIPCPAPVRLTSGPHQGKNFGILHGKPAAIVQRLPGRDVKHPGPNECQQIGEVLAKMHLAAASYGGTLPNLRGLSWWTKTEPLITPYLNGAQRDLLSRCLREQQQLAPREDYLHLPRAAVHADLFRDNAMFDGTRLGGVFDFYFAGVDTLLFDVAVTANDWCIDVASGDYDLARLDIFLHAYSRLRPLQSAEIKLWPSMQRAAALRFWISRLWDFHLPRAAEELTAHDPRHFERVLRSRFLTPHLICK